MVNIIETRYSGHFLNYIYDNFLDLIFNLSIALFYLGLMLYIFIFYYQSNQFNLLSFIILSLIATLILLPLSMLLTIVASPIIFLIDLLIAPLLFIVLDRLDQGSQWHQLKQLNPAQQDLFHRQNIARLAKENKINRQKIKS